MSRQTLGAAVLCAALAAPIALRAVTERPVAPKPVDPAAAEAGKTLFLHEFTEKDPLCPNGDGVGPVFNAGSCVECHRQAGVGGSGPLEANVTLFTTAAVTRVEIEGPNPGVQFTPSRTGLVHSQATRADFQESLRNVDPSLPPAVLRRQKFTQGGVQQVSLKDLRGSTSGTFTERKTPALFGARLIDEIPDTEIIANARRQQLRFGLASAGTDKLPVGRPMRLPGGRVGHFGWKAQSATLSQFVQAACANELGLGNPEQPQAKSMSRPDYMPPGIDLTLEQCNQITAFISSLPRPVEASPAGLSKSRAELDMGRRLFANVGCADCHQPDVGTVSGLYSDLLLHDMGPDLSGGGFYYGSPPPEPDVPDIANAPPKSSEWRTPPLWGVADAGPYLHDGRAATLENAIEGHGGQGASSRRRFIELPEEQKQQLVAFLKTLRAPPEGNRQ